MQLRVRKVHMEKVVLRVTVKTSLGENLQSE
jgi:hypothetical protein